MPPTTRSRAIPEMTFDKTTAEHSAKTGRGETTSKKAKAEHSSPPIKSSSIKLEPKPTTVVIVKRSKAKRQTLFGKRRVNKRGTKVAVKEETVKKDKLPEAKLPEPTHKQQKPRKQSKEKESDIDWWYHLDGAAGVAVAMSEYWRH